MFFPFHDDNPTVRFPIITCALIAANVVGFLSLRRLPPRDQQVAVYRRGFVPARLAQLRDPQPKPIVVPINTPARHPVFGVVIRQQKLQLDPSPRQVVTSLLTCMFLHGGWMHLIGNMWFLWVFGNNVEDRLGSLPFLAIYLGGGLLASGCHWIVDPTSLVPVIGASGAVATILGAYAVTWPWARVHTLVFLFIFITIIDLPAMLVLGVWFLGQLVAGTSDGGMAQGVAWWAHIGGFIAGVVLMPLASAVFAPPRPRKPKIVKIDDRLP